MEPEIRKLKKLHKFYGDFDYTGFSAKILAKKLGVDRSTISRWLSGKVKPSKRHLKRIKQLLIEKKEMVNTQETKK